MELIFDHIWIVFIFIIIVNALTLRWNSKQYISENPELKEGYRKLFMAHFTYLCIPPLIMGIGDISGIPDTDFFSFRTTEPLALLFHASWIMISLLFVRWIYFKKGAEFLEEHPGLLQKPGPWFSLSFDLTAKEIKRMFPQLLFTVIAIMVLLT